MGKPVVGSSASMGSCATVHECARWAGADPARRGIGVMGADVPDRGDDRRGKADAKDRPVLGNASHIDLPPDTLRGTNQEGA